MSTSTDDRLPRRATIALGLVTIVGFGAWFYGYGVLLEPIRQETGWPESLLSSVYGISLFGSGVLATVAGRLLHRLGSRLVYGFGSVGVLAAYLALAASDGPVWFAVTGAVAGSLTGALGYYAAVHTVIAQLSPVGRRAGAITNNTLWGAFASPIFLPLMAWMVVGYGWRPALRIAGVAVAVGFALVAIVVPGSRGEAGTTPSLRAAFVSASRDRVILRLLGSTFAGGFATSLLILYQVPVMVTAGLTLAIASALAGARGFLQLAGRVPMPWLISRFGSRSTLRIAHVLIGVSCLILPFGGTVPPALAFAVVAGVAMGALVPVESIFSADAVSIDSLGVILGVASLTRGLGAALGPVLGGTLTSVAGSRTPALLVAGGVAAGAALLVPVLRRPDVEGARQVTSG
jgi:MFS family permease